MNRINNKKRTIIRTSQTANLVVVKKNETLKDYIKSKRQTREEHRRSSRSRTERFVKEINKIVETHRELEERRRNMREKG